MSFLTSHHGEYIHDYEKSCNLKLLAMLSQEGAEDVLRESPFVDPRNIRWGSEYLFMNKGWYIVAHNAKEDTCDILYLADGRYYLWQASPASRLLQELKYCANLEGYLVVPFDRAPTWIKELSESGGDEDYVIIIPRDLNNYAAVLIVDALKVCDAQLALQEPEFVIYITTHS